MSTVEKEAEKLVFREAFITYVKRSNLNLARVARETGVSKHLLNALHQRKTKTPNVVDAIRIARHADMSVEAFMDKYSENPDSLRRRPKEQEQPNRVICDDFLQMLGAPNWINDAIERRSARIGIGNADVVKMLLADRLEEK
jgi:transcriptional regulator with XRE-family HTH domain